MIKNGAQNRTEKLKDFRRLSRIRGYYAALNWHNSVRLPWRQWGPDHSAGEDGGVEAAVGMAASVSRALLAMGLPPRHSADPRRTHPHFHLGQPRRYVSFAFREFAEATR